MTATIWGIPPKIRQGNDGVGNWLPYLEVYDNASWFDPQTGGGTRATRYIHVWHWNGVNVFDILAPLWATRPPEAIQPGEGFVRLNLGPTNIGGEFYVVEYGGSLMPAFGDHEAAVEWGREWSTNRQDETKWGARSNTVIVKSWVTVPTEPVVDVEGAKNILREEVVRLRLAFTWDTVKRGPVWRAYKKLGGK